jgi:hypothetical protein
MSNEAALRYATRDKNNPASIAQTGLQGFSCAKGVFQKTGFYARCSKV